MELAHNSPLLCSQVRRDIVCKAIYEYLEVAGIFQFVVKYMKNTIRPLWHKIQANKYLKWCINITGVIFIGSLGSGVWEIVLKPILASGQNLVLSIISTFIGSFRNDIYIQIAKGFHEAESNVAAGYFRVYSSTAFFFFLVWAIQKYEIMKSDFEKLLKQSQQLMTQSSYEDKNLHIEQVKFESDESTEKLLSSRYAMKKKRLKKLLIIMGINFSAIMIMNAINDYKAIYINSAITHYQQIFTICRPFLDQQQEEQIASKFAQVRSREDYEAVVNQLKAVGLHNKQTLPEFTPW